MAASQVIQTSTSTVAGTVIRSPSGTQVWQFTGTMVTTYAGDHGSILGPCAASRWLDTTDGTAASDALEGPAGASRV